MESKNVGKVVDIKEPLLSNEEGPADVVIEGQEYVKADEPIPEWSGIVLVLKSIYFLDTIGGSSWGRFGAIYYNWKGLNAAQIGQIGGLMPLVSSIASPIWGWFSDTYHAKTPIYLATKFLGSLVLLLFAVPSLTTTFLSILLISIGTSLFDSGGVIDSYTLDVCKKNGRRMYGRIRMWASIAWGSGSLVMGMLSDAFGFNINFIVYGVCQLLTLGLVSSCLPKRSEAEIKRVEDNFKPSGKSLCKYICQFSTLIFFLELIIMGAAVGTVESLLFIFIQNELQGSTTLCGLTVFVTVLPELPIFHYAGRIMNYLGLNWSLVIAYICFIVRVWGYSVLTPDTVWYILLLELMHGITFALLWSAAVEYSRLYAPKEWSSTCQSLVGLTYGKLGFGLGSFLGGIVMKEYGGAYMYWWTGIIVAGGLLPLRLIISIYSSYKKESSVDPSVDNDTYERQNDEEDY